MLARRLNRSLTALWPSSLLLTSLHRCFASLHHRFIRCWRIFSWALDIVSGTQYAQCTDVCRNAVGSTGASQAPGRRIFWQPSDAPMLCYRFNRCYWFLQNSSNSVFLWVLFLCFALLGLFTSSLGSRNIHLTIQLVPLIALSFDHQNHSKWHKWCHVRYNID